MEKRTKIVCTIGPASSSVPVLVRMIKNGMNVARLNFSHGTHAEHLRLIKSIRAAAKKAGKEVAILQDLQGPKMRVGGLPEKGVELRKGEKIQFSFAQKEYEPGKPLPVTFATLHRDVEKGHRILMDDGLLEAVVTSVRGKIVACEVTIPGLLKSHKGLNLPDSTVSVPSFTEKDREDLLFGIEHGVDWVALSFVTSERVVMEVRKLVQAKCRTLKSVPPKLIVKLERKEAVDRFVEILDAADAVMIARGDLGIELPPEQVPIIQKECVEICRQVGKPVVVATHMLDSMTVNPRATRAETSDVANAVIDHADAVMLSQETATGKYPDLTVKTMNTIIREAEASRLDDIGFFQTHDICDIPTAIAQTLHVMSENDQIDLIATSATYGPVARLTNIFRPEARIMMACPNETVARQVLLRAGVYPVVLTDEIGTFIPRMEKKMRQHKWLTSSMRVAYVTASPNGSVQLTIK